MPPSIHELQSYYFFVRCLCPHATLHSPASWTRIDQRRRSAIVTVSPVTRAQLYILTEGVLLTFVPRHCFVVPAAQNVRSRTSSYNLLICTHNQTCFTLYIVPSFLSFLSNTPASRLGLLISVHQTPRCCYLVMAQFFSLIRTCAMVGVKDAVLPTSAPLKPHGCSRHRWLGSEQRWGGGKRI